MDRFTTNSARGRRGALALGSATPGVLRARGAWAGRLAVAAAAFVACASCGGPSASSARPEAKRSAKARKPAAGGLPGFQRNRKLARPNTPPELLFPRYRAVGVGQTVHFGLEAVDDEGDEISVSLVSAPASATYDPITLTVAWKPTAADRPLARFEVLISERSHLWNAERSYRHEFSIEVTDRRQPLEQRARPLGPVVETLLTIHDPERLARVNQAWPFDAMLEHAATLFIDAMDEDERAKLAAPDRRAMYLSYMKALSELHDNPRLDPDSARFDKRAFGDPASWRVVAIRPRLDKKWQELRIVYAATKAPEPAFAMFRIRPVRVAELPPAAQDWNNTEFLRLVSEALFDRDGNLRDELFRDKRAHAQAVAKLVDSVVRYENRAKDYTRATFIALATGARLGGGSKRDERGAYASGDGWAWSAMKPLPSVYGTEVAYTNIPIKGFWTMAKPSPDQTTWMPACAPRFDVKHKRHKPGYEVLCRPEGLVDLPAIVHGQVTSGRADAVNMYVSHKQYFAEEWLPLRDPRRDLGEEKGMTCSQCHTRGFGVRDRWDATAFDPRAGSPKRMNPQIATTFFIIIPTERWSPYMIEFQKDQECKARDAFLQYQGRETSLSCPLAAPLSEAIAKLPADELEQRIVRDFERATLQGREAFVALFDFVAVGKFETLLRRHDLLGRLPNLSKREKARLRKDTGEPYPPTRERRTVGRLFPYLAERTVGKGGCAVRQPVDWYSRKLGEQFEPLPPGNERYTPLARELNEMIENGGVLGITCKRGKGGLALVYTRRNSPPGYSLITIYDDRGAGR